MLVAGRVKRVRKPPGQFHHGDLRAAAIDTAVREVEQRGHVEMSLERVAAKLGVTRPALYRHFGDKQALLTEVVQRGYEALESRLTVAFDSKRDISAAMLALARTYLEFAHENPGWFRLQFTTMATERPVPDLARTPPRYRDAAFRRLGELLGDGSPEIEYVYRGVWGLAHGLAMLSLQEAPGSRSRTVVDDVLRVHIAALATYVATRAR